MELKNTRQRTAIGHRPGVAGVADYPGSPKPAAPLAILLLFALSAPLHSDHKEINRTGTNEVDFRQSPEAWAMKYFAAVTLFSGFGPPRSMEPHSTDFAFEVTDIPKLDREERRVGFDGTKEEDTNKAPLVLRPRLTLGLTERISVTGSYVPPVKVFDAKTELAAISLNRPVYEGTSFTAGVRCFAQYGLIEADITCPKDRMDEEEFDRHCSEPSDDAMRMRTYGIELSGSYRIHALSDLTPYLTASYQHMKMEFQVDAVSPHPAPDTEIHDQQQWVTDGETLAFGAGVTLPLTERLDLSASIVYMRNPVRRRDDRNRPRDRRNEPMVNARFQANYRF